MQCTSPIRLYKGVNSLVYPDGLVVPCGKCLSCRIAKKEGVDYETLARVALPSIKYIFNSYL